MYICTQLYGRCAGSHNNDHDDLCDIDNGDRAEGVVAEADEAALNWHGEHASVVLCSCCCCIRCCIR